MDCHIQQSNSGVLGYQQLWKITSYQIFKENRQKRENCIFTVLERYCWPSLFRRHIERSS